MKHRRAIALFVIIAFLIVVSAFAFSAMILFHNQQRVTRSLIKLDEIRYAQETGRRIALWVWRYKYDDVNYLNGGSQAYATTLIIGGYNVESVDIRVEDKAPANRRLDGGEIEITINKTSWD